MCRGDDTQLTGRHVNHGLHQLSLSPDAPVLLAVLLSLTYFTQADQLEAQNKSARMLVETLGLIASHLMGDI